MSTLADLRLDDGIRAWIARIEELSPTLPALGSSDLALQRIAMAELSDLLAVEFTLPLPDGVELSDVTLASRRARRYRPVAAPGAAPVAAPTQLWLHGGGFVAGSIDEILNDRLLARRALDSGVQIFSLDYRLAPEHPYPAPVQDALAALDALLADPAGWGLDPARLGLGGNSAGAAIAASTSLRLRDSGSPRLIHIALEVPPTTLPPVGASAEEFAVGFGLDQLDSITTMYAGPGGPADGYLSPLDAPLLTDLPPHLLLVAEYDPLRDSGLQYGERLRAAGVPVETYLGAAQLHGSPGQTAASPGAELWQREHSRLLALAYR